MSLLDIAAVVIAVSAIVVAYQLSGLRSQLRPVVHLLHSLDEELFHLAQEQNPHYGRCSSCGRRAIVRHVVPRDRDTAANSPDMFYCQRCWWLSSTVEAGDEAKHFKDRMTKEDVVAARAGPG